MHRAERLATQAEQFRIIRSLCKRVYRNDTKQPYSKEYREDDR